jgi:excisionase family DNA binding protein
MKLFTVEQTAAELGVSGGRVRKLIRLGKLKAHQFGARAYLLQPSEVQKLVGKIGNGGVRGRPRKDGTPAGSKPKPAPRA